MPYFEDLVNRIRHLSQWADMRQEQGLNVKPVMSRLAGEIKKAQTQMARMAPSATALKREPNAYEKILALRPKGPRKMCVEFPGQGLASRMKGAWLGRAAGCTLGAPIEGSDIDRMEGLAREYGMEFPPTDYWTGHPFPSVVRYGVSPCRDYLKGVMRAVPVDDDTVYTILGLLILEEYGPDFTTADVGAAWLKYLPMACTAERIALDNLRNGLPARRAAEKGNPYQEWIGADIRSDPWGYAAPGWPEKAAAMAYQDAYLSHRQNGVYGEMFFSAAIAAAFVLDCPMEALKVGLTEIPKNCRLAGDVRWALETAPTVADWREARARVDERFEGMSRVHTNNNACLTIFGLALGKTDFTRTIGGVVAMGMDNDCNAATAGSILGAVIGAANIPEHWWKPFRNKALTYLNGVPELKNTEIVQRFLAVARKVWS